MKEFRLGVLFVHGIGTQPQRDTLVRWGDVLLKVIGRAIAEGPDRTTLIIGRADAGEGSGEEPAEVPVEFRADEQTQTEKWLLAEGWWADSFPAPAYSELVSWSFRALPWSISLHIAQRFWQTYPEASRTGQLWALSLAVARLLAAMAFMPLFMIVLALTLVFGLLPIPELRSFILATQTILVGSIGDSLAFVESPLRAALIRGRILEGLERLKSRCERTVIVAHSQGAAATLDALGGIRDYDGVTETQMPPTTLVPDALVTFGSGVNPLVSLKVLSAGQLERSAGFNAAAVATVATFSMILLLTLLLVRFQSGSTNYTQMLVAIGYVAALLIACGVILKSVLFLVDKIVALGLLRADRKQWVLLGAYAVLCTIVFGGLFIIASLHWRDDVSRFNELPVGEVEVLGLVLFNLWVSLKMILSPDTRTAVTKPVQYPAGLSRWMDVYSSADPVPNGPTRMEGSSAEFASIQVWNRGSLLSDHVTYWDNVDGFVRRVARICAETAESPWRNRLPLIQHQNWMNRRAAWRVRLFRGMLWTNGIFWMLAAYVLWKRHGVHVPLLYSLPSWFWDWGSTAERLAMLVTVITLVAWISAALLGWRWRNWVRADQEALAVGGTPDVASWPPFTGLGIIFGVLLTFAVVLATDYESEAIGLLASQKFWFNSPIIFMFVAGIGVWISLIASRVIPVPRPTSANIDTSQPPS